MCHIPSNNVFDLYELSRETQVCFNVFNLRNVLVHSIKTYYIHLALVSYLSKLTRKVYITNIILRSLMKIVLYGINIDPQLNNLPLKSIFFKDLLYSFLHNVLTSNVKSDALDFKFDFMSFCYILSMVMGTVECSKTCLTPSYTSCTYSKPANCNQVEDFFMFKYYLFTLLTYLADCFYILILSHFMFGPFTACRTM